METTKAQEWLKEQREKHQKWLDERNYHLMALDCIDTLCIEVEDGMDAKKAIDLIYRFAHSAGEHICKNSHVDWRKEMVEFYCRSNGLKYVD